MARALQLRRRQDGGLYVQDGTELPAEIQFRADRVLEWIGEGIAQLEADTLTLAFANATARYQITARELNDTGRIVTFHAVLEEGAVDG